jgi:hypothetical protein
MSHTFCTRPNLRLASVWRLHAVHRVQRGQPVPTVAPPPPATAARAALRPAVQREHVVRLTAGGKGRVNHRARILSNTPQCNSKGTTRSPVPPRAARLRAHPERQHRAPQLPPCRQCGPCTVINKTKQNKIKQNKTKQNKTKQGNGQVPQRYMLCSSSGKGPSLSGATSLRSCTQCVRDAGVIGSDRVTCEREGCHRSLPTAEPALFEECARWGRACRI